MIPQSSKDPAEQVAQLFACFRAGYAALGQLLEQHRDYLLKIVNAEKDPRLAPRQGASEIVQNAFLDIIASCQRKTGGLFAVRQHEDLRKWLRRVALNAMKRANRYETRKKRNVDRDQQRAESAESYDHPADDPSASSICRRKEQSERVRQAVNRLEEKADQMLLRLWAWHRKTLTDMDLAELMDGERSDAGRMRIRRRLLELQLLLRIDDSLQDLQD